MLWTSTDHASAAGGPDIVAARSRGATRLAFALRGATRLAAIWIERAYQRDALAELDDRQLRDIGLTRSEALRESSMPLWRTSR